MEIHLRLEALEDGVNWETKKVERDGPNLEWYSYLVQEKISAFTSQGAILIVTAQQR